LPIGKQISFLSPPPAGKDLNDLIVLLKGLIDIAGIPSIMRGIAGSSDSGYLANQMLAAVQMAYQLATIALQRQREKAFEFSHWIVANKVKQCVYVLGYSDINSKTGKAKAGATEQWLGLDAPVKGGKSLPKNIADVSMLGPVSCVYRPTLPTDAQAMAMIAMQLTNAPVPLYDVRHALEDLMQVEDADSITDNIYVQKKLDTDTSLDKIVVDAALREARLMPTPPAPNPMASLVGPDGQTPLIQAAGLLQPGPGDIAPNPLGGDIGIPQSAGPIAGAPSVGGINRPLMPGVPVPQARGGRAAGSYPGQPGGA
jgi:hypothetical protein